MPDKPNLPDLDPDAQVVLNLLDGFRASKAVFTAVSLGVFDHLHESSATCNELAHNLKCNADACRVIAASHVRKRNWAKV
jgi:hypothetical protein